MPYVSSALVPAQFLPRAWRFPYNLSQIGAFRSEVRVCGDGLILDLNHVLKFSLLCLFTRTLQIPHWVSWELETESPLFFSTYVICLVVFVYRPFFFHSSDKIVFQLVFVAIPCDWLNKYRALFRLG